VDASGIRALDFGTRREATDGERGLLFFGFERGLGDGGAERRGDGRKFDEFVESLAAKELIDAVGKFFGRRAIDDGLCGRGEDELLIGISEGVVRDKRCDVAELRSV